MTLPIVSVKRKKWIIIIYILMISLLTGIVFIYIILPENMIQLDYLFYPVIPIVLMLAILSTLNTKVTSMDGSIQFNDEDIIISISRVNKKYLLSKSEKIKILIKGYEGMQMIAGSTLPKGVIADITTSDGFSQYKGVENKITFYLNGVLMRFHFYVANVKEYTDLNNKIELMKNTSSLDFL